MILGNLDSYMQKKKKVKLKHQLTPHTKINTMWIEDLNMSLDPIKALEENLGRKISDIPHTNIFTNNTARDIKEKINKWDFMKRKSFCTAKENISKMKNEPTKQGNIFANYTSDKSLISKIYEELT